MQIIRKQLASDKYTKIENSICVLDPKELSDGGLRLYMFLASLKNGIEVTDTYLMLKLQKSARSILKYKQELKKLDLICTTKVQSNMYFIYIGTLERGATQVKCTWELEQEREKCNGGRNGDDQEEFNTDRARYI